MQFTDTLMAAAVQRFPAYADPLDAKLAALEAQSKLVSAWFLPLATPDQYLTVTPVTNAVTNWVAPYGTQKVDLAEAVNSPVWDSSLFSGKGGVTFNGTSQSLTGTGNVSNWPDATSDLYLIMAARNDLAGATAGARRGFGYGDGDTNAVRYVGRIPSGGSNRAFCGAATTTIVGAAGLDGAHTIGAFFDLGGTSRLYNDGVSDGTVSTATAILTLTRVRMGAAATGTANNFWSGPIVAAAVLNGSATLSDFLQLEALMAARLA